MVANLPTLVLFRELGFLPVEVNASDTRNKSDKSALKGVGGKLSNGIRELATNTAISTGPDGKPARVRRGRNGCRKALLAVLVSAWLSHYAPVRRFSLQGS
jgi:hypothetical protein